MERGGGCVWESVRLFFFVFERALAEFGISDGRDCTAGRRERVCVLRVQRKYKGLPKGLLEMRVCGWQAGVACGK